MPGSVGLHAERPGRAYTVIARLSEMGRNVDDPELLLSAIQVFFLACSLFFIYRV